MYLLVYILVYFIYSMKRERYSVNSYTSAALQSITTIKTNKKEVKTNV